MGRRSWEYLALGLGFGSAALTWGALRKARRLMWRFTRPRRYLRPPDEFPSLYDVPYTDVVLHTSDGLRLSAWYTPPQDGRVILALHGNSTARHCSTFVRLAQAGFGVLAPDLRAHGLSEGERCTLGMLELLDAEAALAFLLARPEVRGVGVWGSSMGAATAIRLAAHHPQVQALVADSAFPCMMDLLKRAPYSHVTGRFLTYLLDQELGRGWRAVCPVEEIGRIAPRPVFIIQGAEDELIPRDSAYRLYEAAGEPKRLWVEPGMRHTELRHRQPERYWNEVTGFFATYLRTA